MQSTIKQRWRFVKTIDFTFINIWQESSPTSVSILSFPISATITTAIILYNN